MDIRNWPIDKIMQLPDHCFGRRWVASCTLDMTDHALLWDISEIALPERCVLWEVEITATPITVEMIGMRLALGDQLPTTQAMMDNLEPLIPGFGLQGPEPRKTRAGGGLAVHIVNIRNPIAAAGRRMVIEVETVQAIRNQVMVAVVVSSMPTEVPDWLISG